MTVTLTVNGIRYGGWETIRIERSMETLSGAFDFAVSERWPGQETPRKINPGDYCQVRIDQDVVITGYVDEVNPSYDSANHQVQVTGRDKAGDLVDCSAINSPSQWSGLKMEAITQALIAPFGIPVKVETNTGETFKKFTLEQGETVFEAIQRMAKLRAVLVISDGHGGIVITRASSRVGATALVEGENILSASGNFSYQERFSQIVVKGQSQGDDQTSASVMTGVKAVALDPEILRYRPLMVIAEGPINIAQGQDRAHWELATRKGKSTRVTVQVQGWRQSNGALWEINTLTPVRLPLLKVNANLLIAGTTFVLDGQGGHITELSLVKPDAYQLIREIAKPA